MKNKKYFTKRCQGIALAGMIGLIAKVPAEIVWAIGPGEGNYSISDNIGPGGTDPRNMGTGSTDSGQTTLPENPNAWKRSGNNYLMPDGSSITNVLRRGIDVSRWQGDVDWRQVASDDVSFVMLGTRSQGAVDPYFHKNIQGALSAGISVGVYIYSTATTPEMAAEEADFVLNLIKEYPISYPVALDIEDDVQSVLSKEQLAVIANTFCSRISSAGYYPIIYANEYWLNNRLNMSLMNYPVWVARYSQKPTYNSPVMWQATSTGSVKGISTNVDIDFQFSDFSSVIPSDTWRTIGGRTYYYSNYILQKNSWIYDGNGWYYMDGQGQALKNWQILGGERYYLDEISGKMQVGWKMDNRNWYYLGSSGAASKGWIYDGSNWYFLNQNGIMQTGWINDKGQQYFLKDNGAMAVGWRPIDGKWYYFNSQGGMTTGWQFVDNNWYYLGSSGQMATGLTEIGGILYYLDPNNGNMMANTTVTIDGVVYEADASGGLHVPGPQDVPGPQEIPEPQGTLGPQDAPGPQGTPGPQDAPGPQGISGPQEMQSPQNMQGPGYGPGTGV